ncbi:unnamed protein product [Eruca vesicaria subsp. sativa]|uniref:PI4-kinase N-terminal domain-containing protein n=1 Tax=Eruca vesicaria subsp. sativa TaxID=29727 RepID=A0ABC8K2G9_ERUVS|nr:unnamed protein product [Eruca vesicaria subsp. sativa]
MVPGDDVDMDPAISRAFLVALCKNGFPSTQQSDGDKLITVLLHQFRQQVASFEDESIESLEKQEIIFKLISHVLGKVKVDSKLHDQVSSIARRKLQSMSAFLKKLA